MADIKIATVIPIGESIFTESLTYFTLREIKTGSLVFVPLRKKKVPAILVSLKPVKDVKAELKNSDFELKKIEKITEEEIFSKEFMETAEKTAEYFGTNIGQVINCFTPNNFIKGIEKNVDGKQQITKDRSSGEKKDTTKTETDQSRKKITELIQSSGEDRMAFYKSLIREEFAKKSSIFLCLPTFHEVISFSESLKKGIEDYTIILRPEDTPKKMLANWKKISDSSHPILVITTPIFMSFLNKNFGTLVIEKESSSAYKNISRPYIDHRYFIEELANRLPIRLLIGDTVLRLETQHKKETDIYPASLLYKYRLIGKAKNILSNIKDDKNLGENAIGSDLLSLIQESISDKKNIVLLSARKGLASTTICRDCRNIVNCKKCGESVTLHKGEAINIFTCHKCGTYSDTKILCEKCHSWNLKTIGFGTEKLEEEIKEKFSDAKVFRMDGENVKTYKQGKEIIDLFLEQKGSVLIGTEMALFYLTKPIENIAVISIDTLLNIPDFKIKERLFGYLINAKLSAENNFLIQTRLPENPIFEKALRGDALQFYKEEIMLRKNYDYPPFKIFIKITSEGKKEEIEKEFDELANFMKRWNPDIFKSSNQRNGKSRMNILIKIPHSKWPNEKKLDPMNEDEMTLLQILRSLPPRFAVRVEPESML